MAEVTYVGSTPPRRWRSWVVTLHWAIVDGRMECVGFDLRPADQPEQMHGPEHRKRSSTEPVNIRLLRSLPLASLVAQERRRSRRALEEWIEEVQPGDPIPGLEHVPFFSPERQASRDKVHRRLRSRKALAAIDAAEKPRGGRPPKYTTKHFRKVAQVYAEAYARGEPPTRAVAKWKGVEQSTAAKWVARARDMGFLERGPGRGRAGGVPKQKGERT